MSRTLHIRPRYYRWFVEPGVEWIETNTGYAHLDWEIPIEQCGLVLVDVWDGHYLKETDARSEQIIQANIRPLLSACLKVGFNLSTRLRPIRQNHTLHGLAPFKIRVLHIAQNGIGRQLRFAGNLGITNILPNRPNFANPKLTD